MSMGGKQSLIENVVAIDFGTTNSGYAYCLGKGKELKTNPNWGENKGRILTDILLDSKLSKSLAFGPSALREYARAVTNHSEKDCEISDDEVSLDYSPNTNYCPSGSAFSSLASLSNGNFTRTRTLSKLSNIPDEDLRDSVLLEKIKLQILDLHDATNFQVTAVNREKVHAIQAFAPALEYMKQCCMKQIESDNDDLEGRDILWIVTVPASWESEQRNFMAMAALRAGIMPSGAVKNFIIITESEASAYFCRSLKHNDFTHPQEAKNHHRKENYVVVDAGGGTVDITVVSKSEETGEETEEHESSGGRWGGETVNERFEEYILQKSPDIQNFKEKYALPIELWEAFKDDYNATKLRFHGNNDVTIHAKKDFLDAYTQATGKDILEELAKNDRLECDKTERTIILKQEHLQAKQFDRDFKNIEEALSKEHQQIWNEFDREYKRQKKRFDSNKDRQFNVEIKLDDQFLAAYKSEIGTGFGTGPGIKSEKSDVNVWFDEKTSTLVIPSYAMKWCYYDEFIHQQFEPLEKLSKHRDWIWRKFMKAFEKAKRKFTGEEDVTMEIRDEFLEEYEKSMKKHFGDDLDSTSGFEYFPKDKKLKISKKVMKDTCFHFITSNIVKFLRDSCTSKADIGILYLVGGFGQQVYLQNLLKREFPKLKVLVPKDAHASVMKGAINFAYSRVSQTEHVSKCTFSMGKRKDRQDGRPTTPRDINHCTLVTLVEKDEKVKVSQIVAQETYPYKAPEHGENWVIEIFTSSYRIPKSPTKARPLTYFKCRNGNAHVVTISFTKDDVRFHVNEKDTGNSQVKKITQAKLEAACTIL